ncbi:MAG: DUF2079 domain-containing protein [Nannocystaceae bacterium]
MAPPRGAAWALWMLAIAVTPGLGLWAWSRPDLAALLLRNEVATTGAGAIASALASAAIVGAVYFVALRRRDRSTTTVIEAMEIVNAHLRALVALALLPVLQVLEIEVQRPILTVALITAVALLAAASATAWARTLAAHEGPWLARLRRIFGPASARVALAAATAAQAAWIIQLGLVRHWTLGSRTFDLGIFDNVVYNGLHGGFQVTTLQKADTLTSAHFAPLLHALTPLYAIAPRAEALIVIQALWLASGALPIYLLTVDRLRRPWIGVAVALAYLCHPSLHGVALFDFHDLALIAPLILWALLLLHRRALRAYAVVVALCLLVREDVPFLGIALGLHAWFARGERRVGLLTIAAAAIYLVVIKAAFMGDAGIFMPDADGSYRFANRYSGMIPDPERGGALDLLRTLTTNPGFVVQHVLQTRKLEYLAALAAPGLFLVFAQRAIVWPLTFGLAYTMLASGANLHSPYLHYTALLFPLIVAATPEGIAALSALGARLGRSSRAIASGLAVGVAVAALLCGHKFGALTGSQAFQAGYVRGVITEVTPADAARLAWVRRAAAQIPEDAWVSASSSLGPHVSNRLRVRSLRHYPDSEYLLVRREDLDKKERQALQQRLRAREVEVVDQFESLSLYRRAP